MKSGTTTRQGAIVVEAPAKVNLHLGVGGLRADGYHGVETVLQAWTSSTRSAFASPISFHSTAVPAPTFLRSATLAWLAAEQMSERFGRTPGVAIALDKAIPAGAGLGGGSSDAAAILVGLAALWDLDGTDPGVRNEIEDAGCRSRCGRAVLSHRWHRPSSPVAATCREKLRHAAVAPGARKAARTGVDGCCLRGIRPGSGPCGLS